MFTVFISAKKRISTLKFLNVDDISFIECDKRHITAFVGNYSFEIYGGVDLESEECMMHIFKWIHTAKCESETRSEAIVLNFMDNWEEPIVHAHSITESTN
ncbi:hypothetical protein ACSAZK_16070 [Methanosarcina sp. Mfa9]|uniref:hypothetical protein n=1 Tax=Methanosarcina sp. Mfa9 TaxID=3439063 RepID=UPI003F86F6F8